MICKGNSGNRDPRGGLLGAAGSAVGNSPLLGVSGQWRLRPSENEGMADSTDGIWAAHLFVTASAVWYKTQASFVS